MFVYNSTIAIINPNTMFLASLITVAPINTESSMLLGNISTTIDSKLGLKKYITEVHINKKLSKISRYIFDLSTLSYLLYNSKSVVMVSTINTTDIIYS